MASNSTKDSITCSHKQCLSGTQVIRVPEDSRVEVTATLPSKASMRQLQDKLMVRWDTRGGAKFHTDCWTQLLTLARKRTQPKTGVSVSAASERAMIKEAAKTAERHDGINQVVKQAQRIVAMIRGAKHLVAFTGAGISTSAGIGDFRGKDGKWTEMDRERVDIDSLADDDQGPSAKRARRSEQLIADVTAQEAEAHEADQEEDEESECVPYESLRPTYTHEALAKIMDLGLLKHVISQNADGLHLLSGVPPDQLSELHGNVFMERCEACHTRYERTYYVMDDTASQYYEELEDQGSTDIIKPKYAKQCDLCGLSHRTGRKCEKKGCKGYLIDTIINFRDNLEEAILDCATEHAQQCDVMLCLGTTATVTPASDLITMGEQPLRIIVCNRQKTSVDSECLVPEDPEKGKNSAPLGSRVYGDCDLLLRHVMKGLLSQAELTQWQGGRQDRMKDYEGKRQQQK